MESTDSSTVSPQPQLPPGFRFHPTDEELVVHYLKKKAASAPLPVAIIAEVDLYKFDPWELPAKATFGEQEWYFFSPRDRKYPNGARPNRAAASGYWKATGTDKPVLNSEGTQKVGFKKALVFYGGKPTKGIKTNWIMHEYRLAENRVNNKPPGYDFSNKKNSLRLDDWVLCRIYKKTNTHRPMDRDKDESVEVMFGSSLPHSMAFGSQQSTKLHLARGANNYGALLENDQINLFEGIMINEGINSANSLSQLASSTSKPEMPIFSLKRTTLPSENWTDDDDESADASLSRRFQGDHDYGSAVRTDRNSSIATLLSQLPQTPPLHQQTIVGSLGDGIFGQPYQLPSMNWFS